METGKKSYRLEELEDIWDTNHTEDDDSAVATLIALLCLIFACVLLVYIISLIY